MKQFSRLLHLLILAALFSSTLLLVSTLPLADAQATGLVCIAASGSTTCPSSPPTFFASVGSSLTVAVNVQGSDGFNGFDIRVFADPTIINGTSISIAGSVIQNPLLVNQCVNSFFMAGACQPSPGTDEVVITQMTSTITPTTGRLFSVTYTVTGTTTSTPITYPTGCTSSSVNGTTTCVAVSNAGTVVPENIQGAFVSSNAPPPDFTITANPTTVIVAQTTCATSTITITSYYGFSGIVSLTSTVSPAGPSTSLSPTSVSVVIGHSATSTLAVCASSSTPAGPYVVTTTGTSGSISHSVTVSVTVTGPPDFSIFVTPSSYTVPRGNSPIFTIYINSQNGFAGTVALSATYSPVVRHGPTGQPSPASLALSAGTSATAYLTVVVAHSTTPGTYSVTVTATSGALSHSVVVTVIITQ